MSIDTEIEADFLIDLAISKAELQAGIDPALVSNHSKLPLSFLSGVTLPEKKSKSPAWTQDEIQYLRQKASKLTDHALAKILGRTCNAVKIYRTRLGIPNVSRAKEDWITANHAAEMLGLDNHKIFYWVEVGFIPSIKTGPQGYVRLINRQILLAWCVKPEHWPYLIGAEIQDAKLARMVALAKARWGDEWLSTRQAADERGLVPKDVLRQIKLGKLSALHLEFSLGGRHTERKWSNWFVRRSDYDKIVIRQRGDDQSSFTPRADAWVLKARYELGMSYKAIARTMSRNPQTIVNRLNYLSRKTKPPL